MPKKIFQSLAISARYCTGISERRPGAAVVADSVSGPEAPSASVGLYHPPQAAGLSGQDEHGLSEVRLAQTALARGLCADQIEIEPAGRRAFTSKKGIKNEQT